MYQNKEYFFEVPIILLKYQILDLVACITFCFIKFYKVEEIQNSLKDITLPKYRIVKEKIDGIDIICDYCGHYAGIKNNIEGIKKIYPHKNIKVIYEPVSYNRVINTLKYICDALNKADYVYVCDIFPLRENDIQKYKFSVENIIHEINNSEYWNKEGLLFFDENDLILVFAPVVLII